MPVCSCFVHGFGCACSACIRPTAKKKKWIEKRHVVEIKNRTAKCHNYRRKRFILATNRCNYFKNLGRKRLQRYVFYRLSRGSLKFKPKCPCFKRASTHAAFSVARHAAFQEISLKRLKKKKPGIPKVHCCKKNSRKKKQRDMRNMISNKQEKIVPNQQSQCTQCTKGLAGLQTRNARK